MPTEVIIFARSTKVVGSVYGKLYEHAGMIGAPLASRMLLMAAACAAS